MVGTDLSFIRIGSLYMDCTGETISLKCCEHMPKAPVGLKFFLCLHINYGVDKQMFSTL